MTRPLRILFLCTHNACRSIIAEATLRHLAQGRVVVASAGSDPSGRIHPDTFALLQREGIDVNELHSKSWDDVHDFNPDVVLTVCDQAAGEACPLWLGKTAKVHWGVPDPSRTQDDPAARADAFNATYVRLRQRIEALLALSFEDATPDALRAALGRIALTHGAA